MKVAIIILFAIVMIAILVLCLLLIFSGGSSGHYPDIKDL
jgi:hypothetical protein